MKKLAYLLYPITGLLLLLWIEQGLTVSYPVKTIAKLVLFVGIPLIVLHKKDVSFLRFKKTDRQSQRVAILLGLLILSMIMLSFYLLESVIDIELILLNLTNNGVTPTVFPFIALYILLGNSLLEEFFFRGFLTKFFTRTWCRIFIPSFFFAIYHMSIFLTWFSWPLLLLAITGLWIGGMLFQLVNEKSGTILSSWIMHMFADAGIILVGIYIFYIY